MITAELIDKVLNRAKQTASHSWEYSTVFEALLEYHDPARSIFHEPFPDYEIPVKLEDLEAVRYVKPFIRTESTTLCEGNGSSSDPSSLGVPALMLSASPAPNTYIDAVQRQLDDLLTTTPRYPNGAISHRSAYPSLWADFIYMAPPLLAYYGVTKSDISLARESVRQCELYHDVLATENGYWRHIANVEDVGEEVKKDDGAWCTSNAWAAAGMARVLATLKKSYFAKETAGERASLIWMTKRILDAAVGADNDPSGLLRNYLDDESWFGEVAGTALMAATAFRMAMLEPHTFGKQYTIWAAGKLEAVGRHIDPETGIAAPVVNSLNEGQRIPLDGVNPEGQAFVVLCYAAWKDWKAASDEEEP